MKRVGHKKYKNSNYNSNNEKSQQSSPKSDRKEKEIILQKEEVVDYQSIEKLYMYSNFFERCKIPLISKILSLCEFVHLKMKSKVKIEPIHIAALSFLLQSIKNIPKNINYADLIQRINASEHDANEFILNNRIFGAILGVELNDKLDSYRQEFLSNQLTLLGDEVKNDLIPDSQKDLEQKLIEIFTSKTEEPEIKIDLQFILNEYEESFTLLKTFIYNIHTYIKNSILYNVNNMKELITSSKTFNSLKKNKIVSYSIEKISNLAQINYLNDLCQSFNSYKLYVVDSKAFAYLGNAYNKMIIQPFNSVKIYIEKSYIRIKQNISTSDIDIKQYIIDTIKNQVEFIKKQYGDPSVLLKEKKDQIEIILNKDFINENTKWFINLLEKLKEIDIKQTMEKAKKTFTNIYQKWLLGDGITIEEDDGTLAESMIEMDDKKSVVS